MGAGGGRGGGGSWVLEILVAHVIDNGGRVGWAGPEGKIVSGGPRCSRPLKLSFKGWSIL